MPTEKPNAILGRHQMGDQREQPGDARRKRVERVFRMSSQDHLEAARRELQKYGLHAFPVHRHRTPGHLLVVSVQVTEADAAAGVVAVRVVLAVDPLAEQLPPLD
jgi:hypothetical protein